MTKDANGTRPSTDATADEALVERTKDDARAFAGLYERYVDRVYWYCARRVGDPWAAEDAASQVFAQALAALPRFEPDAGSFRSWLFRIAHNVTVDQARRRRPDVSLDDARDVLVDPGRTPEDALVAAEDHHELAAALAQLTDDQRTVVELRLASLTGAEIALALGRGRSWVDTTHFRAVAGLRKILATAGRPTETTHGHG